MDWSSYKEICDRPDVLSRWMLRRSAQLLADLEPPETELGRVLNEAAEGELIPAPVDFRGPPELRMVCAGLDTGTVARVWFHLHELMAQCTAEEVRALRLVGIEVAWREYRDSVAS